MDAVYYYSPHLAWQIEPSTNIVYILDKLSNKMILLEDTSKEIWVLFEERKPLKKIVENLSELYECNASDIVNDVRIFCDSLLDRGLIHEI